MNTRMHGKFLQKRLSELNNALFFAEGNALIKLPNHCVTEMEIDNTEIFFVLPKPAQAIAAFDTEFPARLDFFKKGKSFRIKVQGKAQLIADPVEIANRCAASSQLQHKADADNVIMIKVSIQFVDYAGTMNDSFSGRLKQAGVQLSGWLFAGSGLSLAE
jgi:hypothetical protein